MVAFGSTSARTPGLVLAPLPLLLWSAVRFGSGGLCLSLLVVAGVSLSNAFAGRGPFASGSPAENTLSLQIFLLAMSVPLMILAPLVEERQRTEELRLQAEQEARREREELAHVLRVATLGELTAALAHEINQPLTAIVTNAQAARRLLGTAPAEPVPVQEALADITEDALRASQVIRRLRALFRKEGERVVVNINAVIEDVIGLLRTDIERRRMVVRVVPGESLPLILGDPVQLQQVVLNVVLNACEATDATEVGPRAILVETTQRTAGTSPSGSGTVGSASRSQSWSGSSSISSPVSRRGWGWDSRSVARSFKLMAGRIWATANANMGLTLHVELPVPADQ
jgi:signal transduction histidine kinase